MVHVHEMKLPKGWAGKVGIEVPAHNHRLMLVMKHGADEFKNLPKTASTAEKREWAKHVMPVLSAVYDEIKPSIKSVEVLGPEGEILSSLEELECHPIGELTWMEIASLYCAGFGPGKTKSLT